MHSYRILVVEDDAATRDALSAVLEADGYDVRVSDSAEAALDLLRRESFHLALIDHQLPGRSGTDLTAALADACPMTAVVLVTGHGSVSAAVKAMKLGAIDYVAKPVDASKLRNLVAGILEGRSPGPLPNRLLEPAAGACRRCTGSGVWVATNTPLEEVEREVVLSTLRANRGNKNRTAKILGISRRSLYDRLARWGSLTAPRQASTSAE